MNQSVAARCLLMLLILFVLGCGSQPHPTAVQVATAAESDSVAHPGSDAPHYPDPVPILRVAERAELSPLIAGYLAGMDTTHTPDHGLVYTQGDPDVGGGGCYTKTGEEVIHHNRYSFGAVWDPVHKAIWCTNDGNGGAIFLKSTDGRTMTQVIPRPVRGWFPYYRFSQISFATDGRICYRFSSRTDGTSALWYNGHYYDPIMYGQCSAVSPEGDRLLISYHGMWDASAETGAGYHYWPDSTVSVACYGRTNKELIAFIRSRLWDWNPSVPSRVYAIEIDGYGGVVSSRLLATGVTDPFGYTGYGLVFPVSTSHKSIVVRILSDQSLQRIDLATGETTTLATGYNPSLRDENQ